MNAGFPPPEFSPTGRFVKQGNPRPALQSHTRQASILSALILRGLIWFDPITSIVILCPGNTY